MKKRKKPALIKSEPAQSAEQLEGKIRQRAYELYERRGKQDGCDCDDWLLAEAEIADKSDR